MVRVQDIHVRVRPTYDWVKQISVVDALDPAQEAMMNNSGWHLLHIGTGVNGRTTLIFGWGDPDDPKS